MAEGDLPNISFDEAIKILGIEDFSSRIVNSSSTGELFYLVDYIFLADWYKDIEDKTWFRSWFLDIVKFAEEKWERPESIFQHISRAFDECFRRNK